MSQCSKWVILWRSISVKMLIWKVAAYVDCKQQGSSLSFGSELMFHNYSVSQFLGLISVEAVLLWWHPVFSRSLLSSSVRLSTPDRKKPVWYRCLNPQKRTTDGPLRCLGFFLQLYVQTPQGLDLLPITHHHLGHPAEFLFEFTLLILRYTTCM